MKLLFPIFAIAIPLAVMSCNKDVIIDKGTECLVFTASIEKDIETKTTIASDRKVNWDAGDKISINGVEYSATPKLDPTKADFTKVSGENPKALFKAFYPSNLCSGGKQSFPPVQEYTPEKFNAPMYAESTTNSLSFKNICGVLKLTVANSVSVKSIKISSDNVMNGEFIIENDEAKMIKTTEITDKDKEITLDCGIGVTGTDFFIAVPAGDYSGKNLVITVVDTNDNEMFLETKQTETIRIASNTIYSIKFRNENLSAFGCANSYIVSESGRYKIKTVKGNSEETVENIMGLKVLWETFGTKVTPSVGELIKPDLSYSDDYITFSTNDKYKTGNAVIAAYGDAGCTDGNILWSWHIWMTDQPEEQVYDNNAGVMMDRNLGATSVTPGDVHSLGLLYQWGRKDPFLGGQDIMCTARAVSTISWPDPVTSTSVTGTISYSIAHPTTFITSNGYNSDWYYTGNESTEGKRWSRESSAKTIYDPCPSGWRVPDGGTNGIWAKASGREVLWYDTKWDATNRGLDFGKTDYSFGTGTIWYPASGVIAYDSGSIFVGETGCYWSNGGNKYSNSYVYCFNFNEGGYTCPVGVSQRAYGFAVRCVRD